MRIKATGTIAERTQDGQTVQVELGSNRRPEGLVFLHLQSDNRGG